MSRRVLREKKQVNYFEPEEPAFDEYIFCEKCRDYVYEYCAIHGPLLVIPDTKVSYKPNIPAIVPRAALTIPRVFLHLARSIIPGAGIGVFSTLTLPRGVRFGPYRGQRLHSSDSMYCWQIYDGDRRRAHVVDARDARFSNWMRYVNCARHWREQNLVAFQYRGELYYRTIKIIPRFTELLVFYGSEYANLLGVNLAAYNAPLGYDAKFGAPVLKKPKTEILNIQQQSTVSKKVEHREIDIKDNINNGLITTTEKSILENNIKSSISKVLKSSDEAFTRHQNININICRDTSENPSLNDVSEKNSDHNSYLKQQNQTHINKKTSHCNYSEKIFNFGSHLAHTDETANMCDMEKLFKCDICQKYFTQKRNLQRHNIRVHTGQKPYVCDFCQKCFTQKYNLNRHLRTHTAVKPYMCDICQKCFTQKYNLNCHLRTHTAVKPYMCDICQKCFTQKYNLNCHLRTHTAVKPYMCDICQKCFTQKYKLNCHLRTHTGVKPYMCDICKKCFTQKTSLKYHILTHTGQKPFICEICQKCFIQKHKLNRHLRTHTGEKPYKCDICQKYFTQKRSFDHHILTHAGEKPYLCDYCQKCFARNHSLIVHLRTHTGEKPYQCDICEKRFTRKNVLCRHLRSHFK